MSMRELSNLEVCSLGPLSACHSFLDEMHLLMITVIREGNSSYGSEVVNSLTNPNASANEESARAISNNASNVHTKTANARPGPA